MNSWQWRSGRSAHRPSGAATERLRGQLRRDVAELQVRLEEALLRSEVYLNTGRPDAAGHALDEHSALLGELEQRVGRAVGDAVVEREAEAVLAGAVADLHHRDPAAAAAFAAPRPRLPLLAGIAGLIAALAASAVMLGTGGDVRLDTVSALGDGPDATGAPSRAAATPTSDDRATPTVDDAAPTASHEGRAADVDPRRDAPSLRPTPLPDDLTLEALVERLLGAVATVTSVGRDAAPALASVVDVPERLADEAERDGDELAPDEVDDRGPDADDEVAGVEEEATDESAAPTDEPAEEAPADASPADESADRDADGGTVDPSSGDAGTTSPEGLLGPFS